MKAIIHTGMHKTGTSSIQAAMHHHTPPGVLYPKSAAGNHSGLMALLFLNPVQSYHSFVRTNRTRDELMERRRRIRHRLKRDIQSGQFSQLVISAEYLGATKRKTIENLHHFLAPLVSEIKVITYFRPPATMFASRFQQRVKSGNVPPIEMMANWRGYRHDHEKFDEIFGRENVTIRKFHPDALKNGDIVQDFAETAGLDLPEGIPVRMNSSLSLEATALLFLQRKYGDGLVVGHQGALQQNNAFVQALAKIGEEKLVFDPKIIYRFIDEYNDDLEWAEARLGQGLREAPSADGHLIASEADLIEVALQNKMAVEELLGGQVETVSDDPLKQLTHNLDLVRKMFI